MEATRIVTDLPTIENTQPIATFQSSAPKYFKDIDQTLLYYGSQYWTLQLECRVESGTVIFPLNNIQESYSELTNSSQITMRPCNGGVVMTVPVWIFVTNESFIIHFDVKALGNISIGISYESVVMSGLREKYGSLYLCVDEGSGETVDLTLIPGTGANISTRDSGSRTYPLFEPYVALGPEQALRTVYDGVNECISQTAALCKEEEDASGSVDPIAYEVMLDDSGYGDDEYNDALLTVAGGGHGAMNVELDNTMAAGIKRAREPSESERKARRIQ